MQDNARTVILSKTTLKCPNLLSSVKATIIDGIEVVWFPASLYEIMTEASVSPTERKYKTESTGKKYAHTRKQLLLCLKKVCNNALLNNGMQYW